MREDKHESQRGTDSSTTALTADDTHQIVDDQGRSFLPGRELTVKMLGRGGPSRAGGLDPRAGVESAVADMLDSACRVAHQRSERLVVVKRRSRSRERSVVTGEAVLGATVALKAGWQTGRSSVLVSQDLEQTRQELTLMTRLLDDREGHINAVVPRLANEGPSERRKGNKTEDEVGHSPQDSAVHALHRSRRFLPSTHQNEPSGSRRTRILSVTRSA